MEEKFQNRVATHKTDCCLAESSQNKPVIFSFPLGNFFSSHKSMRTVTTVRFNFFFREGWGWEGSNWVIDCST